MNWENVHEEAAAAGGDNWMRYALYETGIDTREEAENRARDMTKIAEDLSSSYTWQKDGFNVFVREGDHGLPRKHFPGFHLTGMQRFGDAIDDEWFSVFILFKISEHFPSSAIQIWDNDGEFLLIEAATELPAWLEPSNAANRVFICKGGVHIIPIPRNPREITLYPPGNRLDIGRAISAVLDQKVPTDAGSAIEALIKTRIQGSKRRSLMHFARCSVPRSVAYVLHKDPQLVASAVESFYLRDPISLAACREMTHFAPASKEDMVTTTVQFSRVMYAQMVGQPFSAPKPLAPFIISKSSNSANWEQASASELGMKLTCGFEMLYAEQHLRDLSAFTNSVTVDTYNFDADARWLKSKSRLKRMGYFKENVEGSEAYRELERAAKENFLKNKLSALRDRMEGVQDSDPDPSVPVPFGNPYDRIRKILDEFKASSSRTSDYVHNEPPDSDEWITLTMENFERLMKGRDSAPGAEDLLEDEDDDDDDSDDDDDDDSDDDADDQDSVVEGNTEQEKRGVRELAKMVKRFTSFVEAESDVNGVTFPNENDDENGAPFEFDPDVFMQKMMSALGASEPAGQAKAVEVNSEEEVYEDMNAVMEAMDAELSATKLGNDFVRAGSMFVDAEEGADGHYRPDSTDESEIKPVDIDLNLVKNLLESFSSQEGLPGPASNLLASLGLKISREDVDRRDVKK
ncbi:SGT1 protein-domain-containing protein [Cladochytrium replicatum]|nr:SGT1 protein-domain-containing protein [Cladochytrium replicatum]